jgi:hypothetical protein
VATFPGVELSQEAVNHASGILKRAHDLAARIDPTELGIRGARGRST